MLCVCVCLRVCAFVFVRVVGRMAVLRHLNDLVELPFNIYANAVGKEGQKDVVNF